MAVSSIACSLAPDLVGVDVHGQVGELQDGGVGGGHLAGAPQDGPDPGHQLLDAEGLGDVVVAHAQALDLVLGGVARRQEDDRHLLALVAQAPADLGAVEVGQHDVEHHEVGPEGAHLLERLGAGGRHADLIALEGRARPTAARRCWARRRRRGCGPGAPRSSRRHADAPLALMPTGRGPRRPCRASATSSGRRRRRLRLRPGRRARSPARPDPTRRRPRAARPRPHQVTRPSASTTMTDDIFDSPAARSTKLIGTSVMAAPCCLARYVISIWKP